jgi:hypothetical protein
MDQHQQGGIVQQMKWAFGWFLFICNSLAVSVEVFLHRGMGTRYLRMQVLGAAAIIVIYAGCWQGHDADVLLVCLLLYLFFCFVRRVEALKRLTSGGEQVHSLYTGTPSLMRFTGRMNEITVKRIVEPIFVFFGGIFLCPVSEALGHYLIACSVGLLVSVQASLNTERTRAMDMNDAVIDQQHTARRFREMRGDRFVN